MPDVLHTRKSNASCNKYLLDFPKIVAALKNTSYSGSSFYNFWNYLIGMSDKKINKSSLFGILPSREHFWEELCSVKLLTDVKRFVIFEIEVLKKVLEERGTPGMYTTDESKLPLIEEHGHLCLRHV